MESAFFLKLCAFLDSNSRHRFIRDPLATGRALRAFPFLVQGCKSNKQDGGKVGPFLRRVIGGSLQSTYTRTISEQFLLALIACIIAFVVDFAIGSIASREFPRFTFLPILSGTVGGVIYAWVVYAIIKAFAGNLNRVFFFVALGIFALA